MICYHDLWEPCGCDTWQHVLFNNIAAAAFATHWRGIGQREVAGPFKRIESDYYELRRIVGQQMFCNYCQAQYFENVKHACLGEYAGVSYDSMRDQFIDFDDKRRRYFGG